MFYVAFLALAHSASAASLRSSETELSDVTQGPLPVALASSSSEEKSLLHYCKRLGDLTIGFADLPEAIQTHTMRTFLCDVPPFAFAVFNHPSFEEFFEEYKRLNDHATKEAAIENLWKFT